MNFCIKSKILSHFILDDGTDTKTLFFAATGSLFPAPVAQQPLFTQPECS